jgi:large subunit ribosomal protein L21
MSIIMFAVIKTGGKQLKVSVGDLVRAEKLEANAGDVIALENVLAVGEGDKIEIGSPFVSGASVAAEVVSQRRARKIIIFKKRRRKNSRRKNGHRQHFTLLKIQDILTGGKKVQLFKAEVSDEPIVHKPSILFKRPGVKKIIPIADYLEQDANVVEGEVAEKKADKKVIAKTESKSDSNIKDDIKLIGGVGPALEKKLNEAGITSLKQIAEFTDEDIARVEEAIDFKGRMEREEWVEQAKELLAGKPPRAKVDQKSAQDKSEE